MSEIPIVFIQSITTRWTKRSRGAPASVARNAVPEAIPFSPSRLLSPDWGAEAIVLHAVEFSERRSRSVSEDRLEEQHPRQVLAVLRIVLDRGSTELGVAFIGHPGHLLPRPRHAFSLRPSEWAQLAYNWCEPLEATWAYAKRVLDVRLDGKLTPDMFRFSELVARAQYPAELC